MNYKQAMTLNIDIDGAFLAHMATQDLGDFAVKQADTGFVFTTDFGNIVFGLNDGRYKTTGFTGQDAHKEAIYRAFCSVCDSFGNFSHSYTALGFEPA